ncbi:BatD family protein [Labrenzia sp. OB1]|uniref:BatD family protein n=1 Tax=Labrenzia sp. OB1 TaxID=1561204 RepID=UPI0008387C4D|nr:BatD family protein [Labrenzia sp. OB1]
MRRLLVFTLPLFFLIFAHAQAQEQAKTPVEPIVRTDLNETRTIPGQALVLRITVLVPTWLPEPAVFPTFEVPNVIVRVPSRGTGPTSETVDGETWSGVTRAYHISPMLPGRFRIPEDTLTVTYAAPQTREAVRVEVQTPAFEISGVVPSEAQDLSPFIAARSLTLERTVEGDPSSLAEGDALVLKTVARVSGVSPMFLPPLAPIAGQDGLADYAQSPVMEETEDRGVISGSRSEVVTLMAEFAGSYTIPAASLEWYNLDSGKVEMVTLPEIELTVSGGPITNLQSPDDSNTGFWKSTDVLLSVLALVVLVFFFLRRFLRSARFLEFRDRIKSSEPYAYRQFKRDLGSRDFNRAMLSAVTWKRRVDSLYPNVDWQEFNVAMTRLGSGFFGPDTTERTRDRIAHWQALALAARAVRLRTARAAQSGHRNKLPPMNPVA